jgi:hypothetical protein
MGYTSTLTLPADNSAQPVNVVGQTLFQCEAVVEVAYDENGFNTGQYFILSGANAPQVLNFGISGKTLLFFRISPTIPGAPAATLSVWTDIGSVNY